MKKKLVKEGHWSPYSGQAAEYAHKIMGDVDMVYTNKWTWNAEYRFAWKVDSRGWISVMKVKPFKVAGEREYGYVVYGLSKDGTLREKSWDSWRDIDEAWDRIKMIFKLDIP